MAAVTVFVDDAVQGRFPNICAYDGEPADWRVPVRKQVGGMNPAWLLLVFLGPIGWVVLFFLVFSGGSETLGCLVPVCADTVARWRRYRRDRMIAGGLLVLSVVGFFFAARRDGGVGAVELIIFGACVIGFAATHFRATMGGIGVHLDASRRWVSFTGVADEFAAAVRQQQAQAGR